MMMMIITSRTNRFDSFPCNRTTRRFRSEVELELRIFTRAAKHSAKHSFHTTRLVSDLVEGVLAFGMPPVGGS